MARFRLKTAHQLRHTELNSDVWLAGDKENDHLGDERGIIVGDGTSYKIVHPTLEMEALDAEAEDLLEKERDRLARAAASMNPIDQLPTTIRELLGGSRDDYEERWVPGFPGTARPERKAT